MISAALTATTFAWAVGVAFIPAAANAQTTTSLQAQIAALLAQIQTLQSQLNAQGGTSGTTATSAYSFTKDLTLGSKGADVTALQQLLINAGDLTAVSAPTGYFGTLTQAALAKYQAAKGISPAAGYFGPKTRAYVASLSVSTTTTTTTTTTTGTTTTGIQTTSGIAAPASGMAVSIASNNPAAGSLISTATGCTGACYGAARVPVLSVNFTAGNASGVTVSSVSFNKVGVLSDSSVSGAYLLQNGKVLYQYNSLNQGVLNFSGMSLNVPAGQTITLTLAIDVSGGLSAGNTVSFSLNAASDVSAVGANSNAVTPTGTFPLNGNLFTVTNVSNPNLASVDIETSAVGNQVTAGTQNNLVAAWTFTPNNSKVYLNNINFHVIGSANKGDIRNVKLMVNGTQVGPTLATVNQDGTAFFDASAAPGVLNTGSNNVQVFADIMGSPSYNFQFEILNGYDVNAIDSQYNVPVETYSKVGMNASSPVYIQQGQITVTQDANTPTGNIAKGQSSITLAKFDVYAAGEAVKVKWLPFSLVFTGVNQNTGGITALNGLVENVSIVDDAGGQVGTTINQPPSSLGTLNSGTLGVGTISGTGTYTYTDSFGSSGSPINYTIPANTTRVLSLRADIESNADFQTVTGNLVAATNNLQGMISSAIGSTSGASGSALTLAQSSLVVSANNALGTQNVSAGVSNLEIGSYAFTASSAEGVNVNNVTVTLSPSGAGTGSTPSTVFQNLKLMVNGTQFGTTVGTLAQDSQHTFSGTPFEVPAGSTVDVNVYADTLSSATSSAAGLLQINPSTELTGFTGTGIISNSAVSLVPNAPIPGQNLTLAGAATIQVGSDSTQVPSGQIVMGSTGNSLSTFRFTETSNVENVKITDLVVTDAASSSQATTKAAFSNLTLWNGSTAIGTAGSAVPVSSGYSTGVSGTPGSPTTASITVSGTPNATTTITGYVAGNAFTVTPTSTATTAAYATGTITVAGASTASTTLNGFIDDQSFSVTVASASGETSSTLATAIGAAINAASSTLGVSSTVSGAVVTVTANATGTALNGASIGFYNPTADGFTITGSSMAGGAVTGTTYIPGTATALATAIANAIASTTAIANLGAIVSSSGPVVTITASITNSPNLNGQQFYVLNGDGFTYGAAATFAGYVAPVAGTGVTYSQVYAYSFHFGTPVVVPQANSISLVLKGDAASYSSNGATDDSVHTFLIATSSAITALGATSNLLTTITAITPGTASGNAQTVLRSVLTATVAASGGSSHNKSNPDTVGTVTFTANNAGPAALDSVKVTWSGSLITNAAASSTINTFLNDVTLIDQSGNNVVTAGEAKMATSSSNPYTSVWTFGTGPSGFQVSAGGSYTFTLRVNSTDVTGVANTSQSLGANIQAAGDVQYTDSLDSKGQTGLGLPASVVPLTINSITYPIGQ